MTQFPLPPGGPFFFFFFVVVYLMGTCRVKSGRGAAVPELKKRLVPPYSLWCVFASLFCRTHPPPSFFPLKMCLVCHFITVKFSREKRFVGSVQKEPNW